MTSHDRLHAMSYADNATLLYQLEKYRRKYPAIFGHVVVDTRPVRKGGEDFYVPPELARLPIVERLAWDEEGCRLVSCFPFRSHDEPCEPEVDSTRWVKVDNLLHVPACQPACERGLYLDARYDRALKRCRVVNQAKKLFLMYPERYNGAVAKKVRLSYDPDRDGLYIDKMYCTVYGVNYDPEKRDCRVNAGQHVIETLGGTTFFRKVLSAPYVRAFEREYYGDGRGEAPDDSLLDRTALEEAWAPVPRVSERERANEDHPSRSPDEVVDELEEEDDRSKRGLAAELARSAAVDLGLQVSVHLLKRRLVLGMSERLARKISLDPGMRHAFLHGVSKSVASKTAAALAKSSVAAVRSSSSSSGVAMVRSSSAFAKGGVTALKSSFSLAAMAMAVFGGVNLAIDLVDPYEFGKMMYREQVDAIDRSLDLSYFETREFGDVDLSPEDAWNVLRDEGDWEDDMEYYAERYREYLAALKLLARQPILPPRDLFTTHRSKTENAMGSWIRWSWVLGFLAFFVRVDVVACFVLCCLLLWNYFLNIQSE